MGGWCEDFEELGLGEFFLIADDAGADDIAGRGEGDEEDFAVETGDAVAAEGYVGDVKNEVHVEKQRGFRLRDGSLFAKGSVVFRNRRRCCCNSCGIPIPFQGRIQCSHHESTGCWISSAGGRSLDELGGER